MKLKLLFSLIFLFCLVQSVNAYNISIEAQLTDPSTGNVKVGTFNVNFTLYNSSDDVIYTNLTSVTTDANGRFHQYHDVKYDFHDQTYITWTIGSDSETTPALIGTVPYAVNAEYLDGLDSTAFTSGTDSVWPINTTTHINSSGTLNLNVTWMDSLFAKHEEITNRTDADILSVAAGYNDTPLIVAANASMKAYADAQDALYLPLTGGTLTSNLLIQGTLTVLGSYLNASVTNQYLNGSFIPQYDNIFTLGTSANKWNQLYATTVNASKVYSGDWSNVSVSQSQVNDWPLSSDNVSVQYLAGSTFTTLRDIRNLMFSAGRLLGGTIVSNGDGSVNVSSGAGLIREADDDQSSLYLFNWTGVNNIAVPSGVLYIGVDYNGGSPRIVNYTTDTWDLDTNFPLGTVLNQSGDVYILNDPWWVGDGLTNVIERFQAEGTMRDNEIGGLSLGNTGTRNPTLTAGTVWARLNEFEIDAVDCSGSDRFHAFYRDGGTGWTRQSNRSQWNNTHYDTGTGTLVAMNNNYYANIWVFLQIDGDEAGKLMLIYPQNQFSSSGAAEAASVPTFPAIWYKHGLLVGRIIFKKGVDAPVSVQSTFTTTFSVSQISDHGNLAGLTDDDHPQYALDTELQNSTVVRNYNTSWVKTNQDYWNGTDVSLREIFASDDINLEDGQYLRINDGGTYDRVLGVVSNDLYIGALDDFGGETRIRSDGGDTINMDGQNVCIGCYNYAYDFQALEAYFNLSNAKSVTIMPRHTGVGGTTSSGLLITTDDTNTFTGAGTGRMAYLHPDSNATITNLIGMEIDLSNSTSTKTYPLLLVGNSVGINTRTPALTFEVNGTGNFTDDLYLEDVKVEGVGNFTKGFFVSNETEGTQSRIWDNGTGICIGSC